MRYFLSRKLSQIRLLSELNLWLKSLAFIRSYGVTLTHGSKPNNWFTELLFWSLSLKSPLSKMNSWTYQLTALNKAKYSLKILNHLFSINLCPLLHPQRGNSSKSWLIYLETQLSSISPILMNLREKKFRSHSGNKFNYTWSLM